ncbi:MAG: DUF3667 domain-containing protein [Opitutaceae bacterium]|nr:DUF3667 domain-containing protein [Opitutaceae bacterium]
MSHPGTPPRSHCENCGSALQGPYCHRCGQHDFDVHRSFSHTLIEALEGFFHFDTKLFRNVVTLLFQPGRLTAAFNAGKRASQVPPFRFYVFVSILFFFLAFLGEEPRHRPTVTAETPPAVLQQLEESGVLQAPEPSGGAEAPDRRNVDQVRDFARAMEAASAKDPTASGLKAKLEHLSQPDNQEKLIHTFAVAMPKLVLVCLPLFALYTRIIFRRSGQVYLQHLVVALHFHTFVFIWWMVTDGWAFLLGLPGWGIESGFNLAANGWLLVYPFLMLKHLFGGSWPGSLIRSTMTLGLYLATLALAFAVTAVLIVWWS